MWRDRGRIAERQQQFQIARHTAEDETLHHCKVCGRNEVNAPTWSSASPAMARNTASRTCPRAAGDGNAAAAAGLSARFDGLTDD